LIQDHVKKLRHGWDPAGSVLQLAVRGFIWPPIPRGGSNAPRPGGGLRN
jgi:hypothetical protein